jgi:hypothetical protein
MSGKTIKIFLADGSPSGLRTAEIGLSTLKALVIPRAALADSSGRSELSRTGVYFLVGYDSSQALRRRVYVGEGDLVLSRILAHNKDESKEFWDDAIIFVSKDENLTKAHVRYLEQRFISLIIENREAILDNGNLGISGITLPESDLAEMEETLAQAVTMLGVLGYDFLPYLAPFGSSFHDAVPSRNEKHNKARKSSYLGTLPPEIVFVMRGDGYSARMTISNETRKYVVAEGSTVRRLHSPNIQPHYIKKKEELVSAGILTDASADSYQFSKDYEFPSPTFAAQLISGTTYSGKVVWKLEGTKMTFGDYEQRLLEEGGASINLSN